MLVIAHRATFHTMQPDLLVTTRPPSGIGLALGFTIQLCLLFLGQPNHGSDQNIAHYNFPVTHILDACNLQLFQSQCCCLKSCKNYPALLRRGSVCEVWKKVGVLLQPSQKINACTTFIVIYRSWTFDFYSWFSTEVAQHARLCCHPPPYSLEPVNDQRARYSLVLIIIVLCTYTPDGAHFHNFRFYAFTTAETLASELRANAPR